VLTTAPNNYGPAFNDNGGGWCVIAHTTPLIVCMNRALRFPACRYAIERTTTFIKIWFWPRYAANIPQDIQNRPNTVNTDSWGTPTAFFPNTQCDINGEFAPANIIINLTFCEKFVYLPSLDESFDAVGQAETGLAQSMAPPDARAAASVRTPVLRITRREA
jgi:hypothetical protein